MSRIEGLPPVYMAGLLQGGRVEVVMSLERRVVRECPYTCRQLFVEAEGVELMVLILKQRQRVRFGALKAVVIHPPCLNPCRDMIASCNRRACGSGQNLTPGMVRFGNAQAAG